MTSELLPYICLFLGLVTALVAGGLQVFSEFIMPALARTHPAGGIEAMQQINRKIYRTVFLSSFLLLIPVTAGFAIYAGLALSGQAARLIIFAAILYGTTVFLVTAFGNVPMNEKLDKLDHNSAEARTYWARYELVWTRWNHVRTIGAIASAACYLMAAIELV